MHYRVATKNLKNTYREIFPYTLISKMIAEFGNNETTISHQYLILYVAFANAGTKPTMYL